MIDYLLDSKGNLKGVVDFWIVDKNGKLDNKGEYIFINDWHINPEYRNQGLIAVFAERVIKRVPWAKWGYFERTKYIKDGKLRIRIYSKRRWLKIIKRYTKEEHNEQSKNNNPTSSNYASSISR